MINASSSDSISLHTLTQIYQYAALVSIPIFGFGLIINLFILCIFIFDKRFRKTTYRLMCVSVVSDIISTITSLGVYSQIFRGNLDYDEGNFMCRTVFFFLWASFGVSMMNLCLIGIDRYFIIVRPLSSFYRNYKVYVLVVGEIAIWIISAANNAPIFYYIGVHHNDTILCDVPNITKPVAIYLICHAAFSYIIPTTAILIIYSLIISFQKSYHRPGDKNINEQQLEQIKKKRFINMLTWISISYVIISWPFFASTIGMAVTQRSAFVVRENNVVQFLLLFFSIITTTSIVILNPFIYLKFDVNVRSRSLALVRNLCPFQNLRGNRRFISVTPTGTSKRNSSKL
ncbi:C-X-C chemokine receptor type 6 [Trichoplax sp. H2]|nr:C-X-C chemokine receptor type 6 [Trichoplax sp. H2]|eukprot:RDD41350.1 C-X-C chemokine receptor type 6 [Trichoplax sp. H2]